MHSVKLQKKMNGGSNEIIGEENSLSHLCIYMVDAKSLVLEYNTRAMCVVV